MLSSASHRPAVSLKRNTWNIFPPECHQGVITGVDLDITETELLEELKLSDYVSKVNRMSRRINGKMTPIGAVILDFKSNKISEFVFLGYEKKK